MSVASSAGSPTCRPDIISASASTTSSCLRSLTRIRVCATHACPLFIKLAIFRLVDGVVDVGVVEDDRSGLAAELEADTLELFTAQRGDSPAGGRGSREGDLVHARMANQSLSGLSAAGKDRHDAFGQVDLLQHLGQPQSVQWGLGCRLDDHGAAGDQGWDQLRHDQDLRNVPRHDRANDADGRAAHLYLAEQSLPPLHPFEFLGRHQIQVHLRDRPVACPNLLKLRGDPISAVMRSAISSVWAV